MSTTPRPWDELNTITTRLREGTSDTSVIFALWSYMNRLVSTWFVAPIIAGTSRRSLRRVPRKVRPLESIGQRPASWWDVKKLSVTMSRFVPKRVATVQSQRYAWDFSEQVHLLVYPVLCKFCLLERSLSQPCKSKIFSNHTFLVLLANSSIQVSNLGTPRVVRQWWEYPGL